MNEEKRTFKKVLIGLQRDDVESYIKDLTKQLELKDSKVLELERTIRHLENEKRDLIKLLNILKEVLREQNKMNSDTVDSI